MKKKIKLKLLLYIILIASALTGILHNEFNVKYVEDNHNSKNDIKSDLKDAYGNWEPVITRSAVSYPYSVFIEDANNDGYKDIVTTNYDPSFVSIILWNSTSSDWDPQITKSRGVGAFSVFIGDANNDGYNDIVTANRDSDDVAILLWNSTSGDWDPEITKSVGNGPCGVSIGDANNDGYNDIATANYGPDNVAILLWNSTSGDWDPRITKAVGDYPLSVFIGDANNDGDNDIATSNYNSNDVSILLWNSTSGDWDTQITRSVGDHPDSVFIGDADNDGYNDIVTNNYVSDDISILLWNSTSGDWNTQITRSVGIGPRDVFIGDADNDGYNDIVAANHDSDDISIFLWNITSGNWNPQIIKSVGNGPYGVFIGDANNNGYNDIVTANDYSDDISILLWKPPYISILSPENKVYGPLKGYYPATYGFDNDEDGGDPEGWLVNEAGGTVQILSSHNGHNKTVELHETSDDFTDISNVFGNRTNGKFECWVMVNRIDDWFSLGAYNGDNFDGIHIGFSYDGNIKYNIGGATWITITSYLANIWYHFKVEWDCTTNWHLWINGVSQDMGAGYEYRNSPPTVDRVRFQISNAGGSQDQDMYVDAVGYSWDPAYEMGDNLNEGMWLKFFNNTRLDWIAYSLDGSDNKTIFEQEIMPLPEDGSHSIQIFGKDAESREIIKSEIRYFSVDDTRLSIDIINQSFSSSEFRIEFSVYSEIGEAIDSASIQIWWNGGDVSADVQNLENGFYSISLEPITVALGEDPILLNMTISTTGYQNKYFETYIAVHPSDLIEPTMDLGIVNQSFSTEKFNITFFIHNMTSGGIDFATFQIWWNGGDVSADVQNLGNGFYSISLEPITVAPGEDPILLNMTISASGYEDKYFETYLAVDPDTFQKEAGEPSEEFPLLLIVTISVVSVGVIIGVTSIYWLRKRSRKE